jgi:hypothetical protein
MTSSLIRLGRTLLLSAIIVTVCEPMSAAGTNVLVIFSGTSSSGTAFSGYFEYDASQPEQSDYFFNFNGSSFTHRICYHVGTATCSGSGASSEPFNITTSQADSFVLKSKCVPSGISAVISFSKLNVTCLPNALPTCSSGSAPVFPSTGTFTLSGGTPFSGTITSTSCMEAGSVITCPCPPPSALAVNVKPDELAPAHGSPQAPVVHESYMSAPVPVYAFEPRPAPCFSSRFFCRRPLRLGCR